MTFGRGAAAAVMMVALTGPAGAQTASQLIDAAINGQLESQRAGNFGTMMRPFSPMGRIQEAWDQAPTGAGVLRVRHDPHEVVRVRVREGTTTTIVLPAWETITDEVFGSGLLDTVRRDRNVLTVEPHGTGADTSLTVFTERGTVYAFYVRTESVRTAATTDFLVVVEGVPPRGWHRRVGGQVAELSTDTVSSGELDEMPATVPDFLDPLQARNLRFEFDMTGERTLAPDVVFSDGSFTYLYYAPDRWDRTPFPAIFRVVDEVDVPVSTIEVIDTTIVVKEVGALTLRAGAAHVCVRPL